MSATHDQGRDDGTERSGRWEQALRELAESRSQGESVATRAIGLVRQLNLAPWIALAVAERIVTLQEARELDRVGRCKELQPAVLDRRRSLADLRSLLPYAAHFLAVDLLDAYPGRGWEIRSVIRILDGVLARERQLDGDTPCLLVRRHALGHYLAAVERVLGLMKRTRCDAGMALDIDAGRVTEEFAVEHGQRRRALEAEERQAAHEETFHYPPRRGRTEVRRPQFQHGARDASAPGVARDHWPREVPGHLTRDHWPR